MKVLVTGASGFTGAKLTKRLLKNGFSVRALVRNPDKLKLTDFPNLEIVKGDIREAATVQNAVTGVTAVFHIAALFRQAGYPDSVYREINVNATETLLRASHENGVKRFVHCSTVGVHGHIEHPPASETYRFQPGDIYQATKLEGEKKALEYHRKTGFPVSVIRPGPIYGPGDLRLLKLFKLAAKPVIPVIGDGKIFFNMVYVEDLVDAFLLAFEKEEAVGEVFIAAGAENLTLNAILDIISGILEKGNRKIHLPAQPFQALGYLFEKTFIPLHLEPPLYRRRVDFFTKSRSFDISKARDLLGYHPKISTEEGLKRTAEWYVQQGYLKGKSR